MATIRSDRMAAKRMKMRGKLWPQLDEGRLWSRKKNQGFTTIPRTLPLIIKMMDGLSKNKPVSLTYLELWCRMFDEGYVLIQDPTTVAFHAGFTGQRALATWKSRMLILQELGFIEIKPGSSGPISYALVLNPYQVLKRHRDEHHPGIAADEFNALEARAIEIGATDLDPTETGG